MADTKNVDKSPDGEPLDDSPNIATSRSDVESKSGIESVNINKTHRMTSSADRQVKYERAQKALENAALVSKRIKEHRKATAELLGRPFEDEDAGESAEIASTVSEKTGYSAATDTSTTMSVQEALNIPGISESLANTLKQKELLMERIKQYKEISKRPMKSSTTKKTSIADNKPKSQINLETGNEASHLLNTIKEKDNALSVMQVKLRAMETTIVDLQEKINEKDQIIEAKNMATTLMSDSLSRKEKDSLMLLEDTKQQMIKMQENFISMENEWKEEKQKMLKDLQFKEEKIKSLEEANTILENARFEISIGHSKLLEEIDKKNKEILHLQETINTLSQDKNNVVETIQEKEDSEQEKGSLEISQMVELTKKVELLEQLNCQIRQTNIELENKLANINIEQKPTSVSSPSKKGSPLPTRKGGRNTASKMKSPWSNLGSESLHESDKKPNKNEIVKLEFLVQSLNKDILDKEYIISEKDKLILELQDLMNFKDNTILELKSSQKEVVNIETDMVDIGDIEKNKPSSPFDSEDKDPSSIDNISYKELKEKCDAAQKQIVALNEEIEIANKNMIKVKSNHKVKLKQMQKTMDNLSKVSDSNAEIIKLNEELHLLSQKVAELEEEKGNLQLHLVDYDSGRLTDSDIYKRMIELENVSETRLKAISVLETQKFDLVQELHILQQKNMEMEDKLADLTQLESEQVCSEMKSVQLEEQIDEMIASRKKLELIIENLKLDTEQLNSTIELLKDEKEQIAQRLEGYVQVNLDLTEKLEKLSAEKVSSAESIEMVESLTTQEKLELEEYNKGIDSTGMPTMETYKEDALHCKQVNVESLIDQITELNKKINLFTQEREEVMDKMNKINSENEKLHQDIMNLNKQCTTLKENIDVLSLEKQKLLILNEEISQQVVDLNRERQEIIKETADATRPIIVEESLEVTADLLQDEKGASDKGVNRNKNVKQLTKEILKLKNIIKEREAEIADCHMKILSLEEQHQKQTELLQSNSSIESKLKALSEENQLLKDKLSNANTIEYEEVKQANKQMQEELQKTHKEYANNITVRDARINELENLLLEYENQIFNYSNMLQRKDKEMVDYINQITKLNDVSQKLKSTIDVLEEEKSKDQNGELIKSLNKQISTCQKKLGDCEEKIKVLEEEKLKLLSAKTCLENKNVQFEAEIKTMEETLLEKQNLIKELQSIQKKHTEEVTAVMLQAKERDEEIHEIKLQLRKESIENEKLRMELTDKEKIMEEYSKVVNETKEKMVNISNEKSQTTEQLTLLESKNKELMEKLKKFAVVIKKKSSSYSELESQFHDLQKQLEENKQYTEKLLIQVQVLPELQEKMRYAEEEINRFHNQKKTQDLQKSEEVRHLKDDIQQLEQKLTSTVHELDLAQKELLSVVEINTSFKKQTEVLNNKLVEYEIELKNNMNISTKITTLESEINQKQAQVTELLQKLENQEQLQIQLQYGHDAKIQERDLYIESLETEMNKYKSRICRLEETISIMEDRRHSLERKADQLDFQLQEKQKAYSDHTTQEDELVNRLAVLMDHDRVVDKQLHEIEDENKQLQHKVQYLTDENKQLSMSISEMREHYNKLLEKANKAEAAESEVFKYESQLREYELQHRRIAQEHNSMIMKKKQDIDELESEFNTQIENAIKEKKILSEKYEKVNEHIGKLEMKLQEYANENKQLQVNIEELNRVNQELHEIKSDKTTIAPDYTDQYIAEINRLNSIINKNNNEIDELNGKLHNNQITNATAVSNFESKVNDLTNKLQQSTEDVDVLIKEVNTLKQDNDQLQELLLQKEEKLKEINEKKKVTIEMSIPKTEGMVISSTIEPLNVEETYKCNVLDLESQIITDDQIDRETKPAHKDISEEHKQAETQLNEELIVPKKAYLCYKQGDNVPEIDPFNSDEGWGLGESEDVGEPLSTLPSFQEQIQILRNENESLKKDLHSVNIKLAKVVKKYKELKSHNEVLSNELKLSKQISQSTFLDNAIEDELRNNVHDLEQKLQELSSHLLKERHEKESVQKQNEIFINANEKLTEMKEKMDNEIELWKYKFKEANDKVSSLQWSDDKKDHSDPTFDLSNPNKKNDGVSDEFVKLEKENDELQIMVDQLTFANNELLTKETSLRNEINNLQLQMQQQNIKDDHQNNMLELESKNTELIKQINVINQDLTALTSRFNESVASNECLKDSYNKLQHLYENEKQQLLEKCKSLENDLKLAKEFESKSAILTSEINLLNEKLRIQEVQMLNDDNIAKTEKYRELEKQNDIYKSQLEDIQNNMLQLEHKNLELTKITDTASANFNSLDIRYNECLQDNEKLKHVYEELQQLHDHEKTELINKCVALETNLKLTNEQSMETNIKLQDLTSEITLLQDKYKLQDQGKSHKDNKILEEQYEIIKCELEKIKTVNQSLESKLLDFDHQIQELTSKNQNLNTENDQLLSTVTELRSSVSSAVDQRGFEIAELWKQHLTQREADFLKTEQELRTELNNYENKYEQLLDSFQSSNQEETNNVIFMEQITSLQTKIQDKEDRLIELQRKYTDVINQLDLLRSELEDEKVLHENKLLSQQDEFEKIIHETNQKYELDTRTYEEKFKDVQNELVNTKVKNEELNEQINSLNYDKMQLEATFVDLNNKLRVKESEIQQKAHEFTIALTQRNEEFDNVREHLLQYEKKIEDLTYEKEAELAVLRLKLHDNIESQNQVQTALNAEKLAISEELNRKIIECTNLNKQIADLNRMLEEQSSKANEMQTVLENQELEIVTLKDEIFTLQQIIKKTSTKLEKHVTFASDTKTSAEGDSSDLLINKELLDAVPRAELDLALYMLHQRDVRCEELTMELTQLLEERDTLQLRLSDSLRSNEELKSRFRPAELNMSSDSIDAVSDLPSFGIEKEQYFVDTHRGQTSRSSSVSDVDPEKPKLQAKLSELRTMKYGRDVSLRQESEQRQLGLRLMQRDVANLPPEAVDQLAQAHHTLTRDSQSTSTVLLNWLRGKSTPKVVHM